MKKTQNNVTLKKFFISIFRYSLVFISPAPHCSALFLYIFQLIIHLSLSHPLPPFAPSLLTCLVVSTMQKLT